MTETFIQPPKLMLACPQKSAPGESPGEQLRARLAASASLSTISRTVSPSFQSAFHLSITLLVHYRSLASI